MDGAFWLAMINGTVASASATVTADSAQARRTAIPVRRGARIDGILGIRRPRIVTAVRQVALGGPQMPPSASDPSVSADSSCVGGLGRSFCSQSLIAESLDIGSQALVLTSSEVVPGSRREAT